MCLCVCACVLLRSAASNMPLCARVCSFVCVCISACVRACVCVCVLVCTFAFGCLHSAAVDRHPLLNLLWKEKSEFEKNFKKIVLKSKWRKFVRIFPSKLIEMFRLRPGY